MKKRTVDDFSIGESITWREHTGFINFISEQYLTLCIRTYDKPKEIAEHSRHKQNSLCSHLPTEWDNIVRTTRLHQTNNEGTMVSFLFNTWRDHMIEFQRNNRKRPK